MRIFISFSQFSCSPSQFFFLRILLSFKKDPEGGKSIRLKSIAYESAQDLLCPRLPLSRNDVISIHDPSNENIIVSAVYLHQRECLFIPDPASAFRYMEKYIRVKR